MLETKRDKILFLIVFTLFSILVLSIILFCVITTDKKADYTPEQIHIAIGDDISQIVIVWSTRSDPKESIVRFGFNDNITSIAKGDRKLLDSEGELQYIHFVYLKHLIPETTYSYFVGSHKKWSKVYEFITFPKHHDWSPSVALVGDMGVENGRSIPSLIKNTIKGKFDVIIHVGDIAYNLYAFKGQIGDAFMRTIQPFAARVPYMVVPGNHEYLCYGDRCPGDFGNSYETRFKMPKSRDNSHYTFTLGSALFIAISTEVYFQSEMSDLEASQTQRLWLQRVLYEANRPENRARHPWIIVYGHKPLYCTSSAECFDGINVFVKEGNGVVGSLYDIDDLLYQYGVDIAFWGHQHYYERTFPVYNQTAFVNSMYENAFVNPRATVHIISGTGGMHSGTETFSETPALWTAFRSSAYGYTRFTVVNASHLYLEQIDVNQNDRVIDSIWMIQDQHIPFPIKNKKLFSNNQ